MVANGCRVGLVRHASQPQSVKKYLSVQVPTVYINLYGFARTQRQCDLMTLFANYIIYVHKNCLKNMFMYIQVTSCLSLCTDIMNQSSTRKYFNITHFCFIHGTPHCNSSQFTCIMVCALWLATCLYRESSGQFFTCDYITPVWCRHHH